MKKNLIILSAASLLSLASCGGITPALSSSSSSSSSPSSSSGESESSSSTSISSESSRSSESTSSSSAPSSESSAEESSSLAPEESSSSEESSGSFDPFYYLSEALNADYSNMTSCVGQISPASEEGGSMWYTYYADDYEVVYSYDLALMGAEDYAYSFFHDYNGRNYNYFRGNASQGERSGWLTFNERYGVDLTLASNYGDERALLNILKENEDAFSFEMGLFWIDDPQILNQIVEEAYPNLAYVPDVTESYWFDSTSINVGAVFVNDSGLIYRIALFDETIDTDYNIIDIQFYDIGSTSLSSVASSIEIPEAPNEENTLEFWEYKGLSGPYVHVYPSSIEVSPKEGSPAPIEGVYTLEIEDSMALSAGVEYSGIEPGIEEERIVRHGEIEWKSSDESVASVEFGKITAVAAGDAEIYAVSKDEQGSPVTSNRIKIHVNALAPQNLEGAVYNFNFAYIGDSYDEKGFAAVKANNILNNDYPFVVKANKGVSILPSKEDSIFGGAKTMIMRISAMETMHDEEFAGDAVLSYDFDDQQVSGISFYYGGFYSNYKDGASWLESAKIQTSNDGETWVDACDITSEILDHISDTNLKLLERSFDPASKVRIVLSSNMIGVNFHMAFPSMAFIANENCHSHIDAGANPLTNIEIHAKDNATSVRVGKYLQILPSLTPEEPSNPTLTWEVDDESIATIDSDGLLHGLKAGTVHVTAKDNTGLVVSNSLAIEVEALPAIPSTYNGTWKGEDLSDNDVTLLINGTSMTATVGNYEAILTYSDYDEDNRAFVFANESDEISLSYSSYESKMSVRGKLNGVDIKEGNGNPKEYSLYVPATSISLSSSATNNSVVGGQSFTISASFVPTNATVTELTWISDHPDLVEIVETDTGAYIYTSAVSEDTLVTFTATNEEGISASIAITLTAPKKVASIQVSLESSSIEIGRKTNASATILPDNADNPSITWSSSDTSVAKVDKNGVVTGVSAGTAKIIATATDGSGVTGEATITVTEPAGDTIDGTYTGLTNDEYASFTLTISENGSKAHLEDDVEEEGDFALNESLSSGNVYVYGGEWNYSDAILTLDLDDNTLTLENPDGETYLVYYGVDQINGVSIAKA